MAYEQNPYKKDGSGNMAVVQDSCTMTEVDCATDADVTVTASPAVLLGIYINTVLSTHVQNIKDGSTTKIVLPVDMAAGSKIDCHSAKFATSIVVNGDNAATGKILVFWRAV